METSVPVGRHGKDRADPAAILNEQSMFHIMSFLAKHPSDSFTIDFNKGKAERKDRLSKSKRNDDGTVKKGMDIMVAYDFHQSFACVSPSWGKLIDQFLVDLVSGISLDFSKIPKAWLPTISHWISQQQLTITSILFDAPGMFSPETDIYFVKALQRCDTSELALVHTELRAWDAESPKNFCLCPLRGKECPERGVLVFSVDAITSDNSSLFLRRLQTEGGLWEDDIEGDANDVHDPLGTIRPQRGLRWLGNVRELAIDISSNSFWKSSVKEWEIDLQNGVLKQINRLILTSHHSCPSRGTVKIQSESILFLKVDGLFQHRVQLELICPNLRSFTCRGKVVGNTARLLQTVADISEVGAGCGAFIIPQQEHRLGRRAEQGKAIKIPFERVLGQDYVNLVCEHCLRRSDAFVAEHSI